MTDLAGAQSMPFAGRRNFVLRSRLLAFGSAAVSQRRGPGAHEQWAHFRFSVIGQLLAARPGQGTLRQELDKLAARMTNPVSGEPVRFGVSPTRAANGGRRRSCSACSTTARGSPVTCNGTWRRTPRMWCAA